VNPWITKIPILLPGRTKPSEFGMVFTLRWWHTLPEALNYSCGLSNLKILLGAVINVVVSTKGNWFAPCAIDWSGDHCIKSSLL
jgi:hypothetical protein